MSDVSPDPGAVSSVVVYGAVSPEAESAAALVGGACFLDAGRWSLWVPADPAAHPLLLAVALSRAGGRRDRAMWLWRDGDDAGYRLLVGRRTVGAHVWAAAPDSEGGAVALARWAGRPDLEVSLRALLRRR